MKKLKPILLLLLVFLSGVAVGVVATRLVVRNMVRQTIANPNLVRDRIEHDLAVRLDLSSEQRAKVRAVLERSHEEMRQLRMEVQPRFADITKRAETEIRETLTPEQRAEFEQYISDKKLLWRPPFPPHKR